MTEENKSWQETFLTADQQASPALKDFKDVAALAQSFVDTKSALGGSIRIPSENADAAALSEFHAALTAKVPGLVNMPAEGDEEAMNALWTRLGRPVTLEGYKLDGEFDNATELTELGKKLGMTNTQLNAFAAHQKAAGTEGNAAALEELNASRAEVLGEWGAAKDLKHRQIATMMERTGAPEALIEVFNAGNVDGGFMRWAETLVTSLSDETSTFTKDINTPAGAALTPTEANHQISEILSNAGHPYHNALDPSHKAAVKKFVNLHDYAAGRAPSMS